MNFLRIVRFCFEYSITCFDVFSTFIKKSIKWGQALNRFRRTGLTSSLSDRYCFLKKVCFKDKDSLFSLASIPQLKVSCFCQVICQSNKALIFTLCSKQQMTLHDSRKRSPDDQTETWLACIKNTYLDNSNIDKLVHGMVLWEPSG